MTKDDRRLIIPYRDPLTAKSRLSSALSRRQRAGLSLTMLDHVLGTALTVLDGQRVVVLTRSPRVLRMVRGRCRVLLEDLGCLNAALAFAVGRMAAEGCGRIAIIHADLPYLCPGDIDLLFDLAPRKVAIAPDTLRIGTNALAFRAGAGIRPSFGPGSFGRHMRMAAGLGLDARPVTTRGLARDVDWPEDLAPLRAVQGRFVARATWSAATDRKGEVRL